MLSNRSAPAQWRDREPAPVSGSFPKQGREAIGSDHGTQKRGIVHIFSWLHIAKGSYCVACWFAMFSEVFDRWSSG